MPNFKDGITEISSGFKTIGVFWKGECRRQMCGIPWTVESVSQFDESAAVGDTMATDLSPWYLNIHIRPLRAEVWMITQTATSSATYGIISSSPMSAKRHKKH